MNVAMAASFFKSNNIIYIHYVRKDMMKPAEGYGTTTVFCLNCEQTSKMYGYLPIARQIWHLNEGMLCCNQQTVIIKQEEE